MHLSRANCTSCSWTVKHSVHPFPPRPSTASASSHPVNARGNQRASTRSASRSHEASVFRAQTMTCAPARMSFSTRLHFHARPTLSTRDAGQ